jgi:CHAP domain
MDKFQQFINEWLPPQGPPRRIDYDRVYKYQCVDLVLEYLYEVFHIPSGVGGNAIDYWNNPSPRLLRAFDKVPSQNAIRGDIVVLHGLPGHPDGHIGIATGKSNETEVEILEQNGQNGDGDGGNPDTNPQDNVPLNDGNQIRTRFVPKSRIAGLLRAKDRSAFTVPNADTLNYTVLSPMAGYVNADDASKRHNSNSQVPAGTYAVFNEYNGMLNVTRQAGSPGWWINPADNHAAAPAHTPAEAVYVTVQPGWGLERIAEAAGFKDAATQTRWQAITDLNGGGPWSMFNARLRPGQRVMVSAAARGAGDDAGTPASETAPATPSTIYERFDEIIPCLTKEGAKSYNFELNMPVVNYGPNEPFEAVGKATLPNGDGGIIVYFMDKDNFSPDDESKRSPVGIKTGDLSLASKPESAPAPTAEPTYNVVKQPGTITIPAPGVPEVPDADLPWQRTMQFFSKPKMYVANKDTELFEFPSGNPIKQKRQGARGEMAGTFIFAGGVYYRTQESAEAGRWEGYLVSALDRETADNTPFNTNDDINQIGDALDVITKKKHAQLRAGGTLDGLINRLRGQRSNS